MATRESISHSRSSDSFRPRHTPYVPSRVSLSYASDSASSANFEHDCKEAALEEALAKSWHLRRGHLLVDGELLFEHWWVTSGKKISDPTLMDVRGRSRLSKNITLEYLPIDPEGVTFDGQPWTECMKSWGDCDLFPYCAWCTARYNILRESPNVRPGEISINFSPISCEGNFWATLREN